jgi:acetolactate synthase small subunit
MRRAVFSILVGNSSGVLSRVAGMFSRRGYNIDSLTVGETLNPELSRMTIAVTGEDDVLEQIEGSLHRNGMLHTGFPLRERSLEKQIIFCVYTVCQSTRVLE